MNTITCQPIPVRAPHPRIAPIMARPGWRPILRRFADRRAGVVLPAIVPGAVAGHHAAVIAGTGLSERTRIAEAVGLSLLPIGVAPGLVGHPAVLSWAGP